MTPAHLIWTFKLPAVLKTLACKWSVTCHWSAVAIVVSSCFSPVLVVIGLRWITVFFRKQWYCQSVSAVSNCVKVFLAFGEMSVHTVVYSILLLSLFGWMSCRYTVLPCNLWGFLLLPFIFCIRVLYIDVGRFFQLFACGHRIGCRSLFIAAKLGLVVLVHALFRPLVWLLFRRFVGWLRLSSLSYS